jgi:hypothetical protein
VEIYSLRRFPIGAVFWGGVAIVFLAIGLAAQNPHPAIFALAPAMLALGLLLARPRKFCARLTDEGLEVENPPLTIPYADIEGVTINGVSMDPNQAKSKKSSLVVTHRHGVLDIPAALNVPSFKVYQAILAMLPPTGDCRLSAELMEHFQKETAMFGPERVHAFRQRDVLQRRSPMRRGTMCAAMLLACGVLWCFVPVVFGPQRHAEAFQAWIGCGILLAVFSFLFWFLFRTRQRSLGGGRLFRNGELVISPTGIALKQGDMQGLLRLEEVRDVRNQKHRLFMLSSNAPVGSIQIFIAGASIPIPDVYDRPIAAIEQWIRRYWKK